MADELTKTVRIIRRPKVTTDHRGRTVWADPVESAELELVTTRMLRAILTSEDERQQQQIREAADSKDGLLARDAENDRFEIIDDDDFQAAIDASSGGSAAARSADVSLEKLSEHADTGDDELSLVSTQMLRRLLQGEPEPADDDMDIADEAGFDPYNSG